MPSFYGIIAQFPCAVIIVRHNIAYGHIFYIFINKYKWYVFRQKLIKYFEIFIIIFRITDNPIYVIVQKFPKYGCLSLVFPVCIINTYKTVFTVEQIIYSVKTLHHSASFYIKRKHKRDK